MLLRLPTNRIEILFYIFSKYIIILFNKFYILKDINHLVYIN